MHPQEMTPCYYPISNAIYIPVAALEAPFFSVKASREENLGGIGIILGHEITHAFDDLGSPYDERGKFGDWRTAGRPWGKYRGFRSHALRVQDRGAGKALPMSEPARWMICRRRLRRARTSTRRTRCESMRFSPAQIYFIKPTKSGRATGCTWSPKTG